MASKHWFKTITSNWLTWILRLAPCVTFLIGKQHYWVLSLIVRSRSPQGTNWRLRNLDLISNRSSHAMATTCLLKAAYFRRAKPDRSIYKFRRLWSSMLWVVIRVRRWLLRARTRALSRDRTSTTRESRRASRSSNLKKSWSSGKSIPSLPRKRCPSCHQRPSAFKRPK